MARRFFQKDLIISPSQEEILRAMPGWEDVAQADRAIDDTPSEALASPSQSSPQRVFDVTGSSLSDAAEGSQEHPLVWASPEITPSCSGASANLASREDSYHEAFESDKEQSPARRLSWTLPNRLAHVSQALVESDGGVVAARCRRLTDEIQGPESNLGDREGTSQEPSYHAKDAAADRAQGRASFCESRDTGSKNPAAGGSKGRISVSESADVNSKDPAADEGRGRASVSKSRIAGSKDADADIARGGYPSSEDPGVGSALAQCDPRSDADVDVKMLEEDLSSQRKDGDSRKDAAAENGVQGRDSSLKDTDGGYRRTAQIVTVPQSMAPEQSHVELQVQAGQSPYEAADGGSQRCRLRSFVEGSEGLAMHEAEVLEGGEGIHRVAADELKEDEGTSLAQTSHEVVTHVQPFPPAPLEKAVRMVETIPPRSADDEAPDDEGRYSTPSPRPSREVQEKLNKLRSNGAIGEVVGGTGSTKQQSRKRGQDWQSFKYPASVMDVVRLRSDDKLASGGRITDVLPCRSDHGVSPAVTAADLLNAALRAGIHLPPPFHRNYFHD